MANASGPGPPATVRAAARRGERGMPVPPDVKAADSPTPAGRRRLPVLKLTVTPSGDSLVSSWTQSVGALACSHVWPDCLRVVPGLEQGVVGNGP